MLGRRDQYTLFLQTGSVADLGHIAADGLNFKTIQIDAPKDNAASCRSRKNTQIDRSATVQPYALAMDWCSNCLFE